MVGERLNFGTSVVKREGKSIERVDQRLRNAGWKFTGQTLGGRVKYYELAGVNITAVGGPLGTTIMPSGPIRGAIFGDNAVTVSRVSAIGAGDGRTEAGKDKPKDAASEDVTSLV